ncbi:MAG: malto-oligosyltrehalose synthase [Streptosporangiaceae bacterium]
MPERSVPELAMPEPGDQAGSVPASTYRLQLRPGFGFTEAARIADYLAALGVTHVYLSPVLQAAPGSGHGYDVVDHSRISAELGGEAAFHAMVGRFRHHGLGVVVDVVPNHMAIPEPAWLNRQLWSVLQHGPGSPYAHWFDVDWAARGGRFLLPILGGPAADCLADLAVESAGDQVQGQPADEPVLRYFGQVLPVRPGTEGLPLAELLDAQHYELASWRTAATDLNWRRFFDVTSLIAIRVEHPDVFAATHGLLLGLLAEGAIDGLRVDHPDGLADPAGYLRWLTTATGGSWVVSEKILTGAEELPGDWQCAGTTGYDALGAVGDLFIDSAGARPLSEQYVRLTGGPAKFGPVAHAAKRETAARSLAAEVGRLARLARQAAAPALAGVSQDDLRTVLVELLAGFGVYRAYVTPGLPPSPASVAEVQAAAATARGQLPDQLQHPALNVLSALVLGDDKAAASGAGAVTDLADGAADEAAARRCRDELVVRFGQTCGPVLAKGVEDTAFYRWSRLVALNEVGGDPDRFGAGPESFHSFAGRLARDWPATMTTLSTHDTKRQEDVRARLAVLAESPRAWAQEAGVWHDLAAARAGGRVPEPDTEYLLWQTLVGAWPIGRDRLADYLRKAMREAKRRTSWTDPDAGYESGVLAFAEAVLSDPDLTGRIAGFVSWLAPDARANSLGAKLVQLTMPGVPDVYQGCELAGYSLVDPDNRRPVDFAQRRRMLAALDDDQLAAETAPGAGLAAGLDAEKLLVTSRALRLRREHPDWFAGAYDPLLAEGPAARHVVAFRRGGQAITVATRLPGGLRRSGGWAATVLVLPGGRWRDVLTDTVHDSPRPLLAALTTRLPVALLVPAE